MRLALRHHAIFSAETRGSTRSQSARRTIAALGVTAALAGSILALGVSPAQAAPAPQTISYTGSTFTTVVPAGVCRVTVTAQGGAGGTTNIVAVPPTLLNNRNGAGARITATYPVRPGMTFSGEVGGAGGNGQTILFPNPAPNPPWIGAAGTPNGGQAGIPAGGTHYGAGGGGATNVVIDGTELLVSGGGGGFGGGHSLDVIGGNAGLPGAAGVTAGSDGGNGRDNAPGSIAAGGQGGRITGPGAGGLFTANVADIAQSAQDAVDGFPGNGRNGGNGGNDPSLDTGAGGGGGYFGGGGGSSTVTNGGGLAVANGIGGGGGGGGASYVNAQGPASLGPVSGISSIAGPQAPRGVDPANGEVLLTWTDCGIVTDSGSSSGAIGQPQRWAPSPTSEETGVPVTGETIILLDALGNPAATVLVAGGSYSVDGNDIVFTPDPGFVGTPPSVAYRVDDGSGHTAEGTYVPTVAPLADPSTPELATTGSADLLPLGIGAALLIVLGAAFMLLRRRRRHQA